MTELVLQEDGWSLSYHYQFFLVSHDDHQSLFVVEHTDETEKQQYDFTRIVSVKTTTKGAQVVFDYKGELDLFECSLTPDHAQQFVDFLTTATKTGNTPHTTA